MTDSVSLNLSRDELIVLLDLLHREIGGAKGTRLSPLTTHEAELWALNGLLCALEVEVGEAFSPEFPGRLTAAHAGLTQRNGAWPPTRRQTMIEKRSFDSLGRFRNDWLNARYHFSFSGYQDPARVHWGALRVWNDDEIAPKSGFPPHSHADMEIITYVREGAITHKDSLGNTGRTAAGDVQVMSAGAGITHAEYNLEDVPTRLFQIWILPTTRGGKPYWGEAKFPKANRAGQFVTLASGVEADQAGGALPIRADARLLAATLAQGQTVTQPLDAGRFSYLVVAHGRVRVGELELGPRDGAAITDLSEVTVTALEDAELVLVDAPGLQ